MLGLAISVVATLPTASANTIVINSGSSVTFLNSGIVDGDFPAPITAAEFSAAQTGPHAAVVSSIPTGYWVPSLTNGPGAVWIGTNSNAGNASGGTGDTALYAASFTLPTNVTSASLTLYYAIDNELGYTNPGLYINGTALPNSTAIACSGNCAGDYDQQNTYTDASITALLTPGTNWIYFDAVNLGLQGGILFSADITYTPTPEPSSALLMGIGVLALAFVARRKRATLVSVGQPAA
jgi:hypothetical protein